ncbi:MAG: hypothetical protein ACWA5L_09500 [bacterium]
MQGRQLVALFCGEYMIEWMETNSFVALCSLLGTVLGAVIVGFVTWKIHQTVSRKRLTFETIQKKYWDVDYVIARKRLNDYRKIL